MAEHVDLDAARLHDELLRNKPQDARHDTALCPFCIDNATTSTTRDNQPTPTVPGIPPASSRSGASTTNRPEITEGGTPNPMTTTEAAHTMSRETHDALLAKAITDATAATDKALAAKTEELNQAAATRDDLAQQVETLKTDNARLNGELDSAQVARKAAEDKAHDLTQDITQRDEAAQRTRLSVERAGQARNLNVWTEDQITEKASRWAELPDTDWAERLEEWRHLGKPTTTTADTASAMTGTTGTLTKDPDTTTPTSTRRAVLGLET